MKPIVITRTINAPIEKVFWAVADVHEFGKALPHAIGVEYLSENKTGVGARFRETRNLRGKEATTELEVTEHVENDHVRMVADSHGTVWDTTFAVRQAEAGTVLTTTMDARAHKLLPRLINPLIRGMVSKAVADDMDLAKTYCEICET